MRWLRGWTTKEAISEEFVALERHSERSKACKSCIKRNLHCIHPSPTMAEKIAELKRMPTLKPFFIIISMFFISHFTGDLSIRPFIVQILKAYDSPISSDENVMILSVGGSLAQITFICLVRFTGKRRIYLTMLFGVLVSALIVSCYGFIYLPTGYNSFNQSHRTLHLEANPSLAYIPTICLYVWGFCSSCSIHTMPLILLSELFPLK